MDDVDLTDCRQCLSGENEACLRLLQRHEQEVVRQMWRFSRDAAICKELVHEVFVEAYLSLRRYRSKGVPFGHWLACIATRVGYRFWRQQARRKKEVPLDQADIPGASQPPEDPSGAAATLHNLISRLPPKDRLVLTLMYFEECGTEEIAQRAGWTRPMVKMRAMRARNRLRKMIEDEHLMDALQGVIHGTP